MKILFPYIAQPHQIFHSLPIAAELAAKNLDTDVHIACSTDAQESLARSLAALYPEARLKFDRLTLPLIARLQMALGIGPVPFKQAVLLHNRDYLSRFDAMVVPERTSLFVKRWLNLPRLKLIWTRHGAGDRSVGYAADAREFDFVLMAGRKTEHRLLSNGTIRPGDYYVGCYAKFDVVQKKAEQAPRLFDNSRTTVLYNPHFSSALSSWHKVGIEVLDFFAKSERYNLIFAPHIRLFDPQTPEILQTFERYRGLPNVHLDLGSDRSIDMSYTLAADIYLGDVSSQVAEFLLRPRPCVFLNPRRIEWQDSPNYLLWHCGNVVTDIGLLEQGIADAIESQPQKLTVQRAYFNETFELPEGRPSTLGAAVAIVDFLKRSRVTAANPQPFPARVLDSSGGLP